MALWPGHLGAGLEGPLGCGRSKAVGWGKRQETGLLRRIHCDSKLAGKTGGNGVLKRRECLLEMAIFRGAANMHLLKKQRFIWGLFSDGSWCSP